MIWKRRVGYALGCVLLLLVLFWVFVVDLWVEREIEARGTEALGTRVDLADADVAAFPPGIELTNLAVVNPSSPMRNAVEVRRITGHMDTLSLLSGRLIVPVLDVEGVRFATNRAVSGAVRDTLPSDDAPPSTGLELPGFDIPNVADILAKEDLASVALIRELGDEVRSQGEIWRQRLQQLPDEAKFGTYAKRISALAEGDPLEAAAHIEALRNDLKSDLEGLESAGRDLKRQLGTLDERIAYAKKASLLDVELLQSRYSSSPGGASTLTASLLGDPVGDLVAQTIRLSGRLQTMVAGGDAPVAENERAEDVDFLVRLANVSVELERGTVLGTLTNITANQPAFGRPMTFAFAADAVPGLGKLTLDGVLDRVDPQRPADSLSLVIEGYDVAGTTLSENSQWPVSITRGLATGAASLALGADDALRADARLSLRDVKLAAPFSSPSPIAKTLSSTVEQIAVFDLRATAVGTTSDYRLKIESSLDRMLGGALSGMLRQQSERLGRELRAAILAETNGLLEKLLADHRELEAIALVLGRRESAGQRALAGNASDLETRFRKLF